MRGGQKQILLLLGELTGKGVRCTLACRPGPLADEAEKQGHPVSRLEFGGEYNLLSAVQLARLVKKLKPDLVHVHDARCHGLARLSQILGMDRPLVVHRRVDFPIRSGLFSRKKYLRGVSRYIAVTRGIADRLRKAGVQEDRIRVIHSSLDFDTLDQKARRPFPGSINPVAGDDLVIACVGELEEPKGQKLLLAAMPELAEEFPNLRLIFLGQGPDRDKLKAMADSMGLSGRCEFPGYVQPVEPVIAASSCVVLPTLSEGFSPAALEAMGLGIPVAASATGGLLEMIDSGEDGLLFTPGDLDDLKKAVQRLLGDDALRRHLGQKARMKVRREFMAGKMAGDTLEVYREVLSSAGVAD
jgi:glycosyltransferase involved in cell wall biosynthesis